MKIKHVMTRDPITCVRSDSAQRAASIMRDRDTGVVPIVDDDKIIGVVTDRDLCMNVVAEGRDPKGTRVDACMTIMVVHCAPDDSVERVTELMRENRVRRVPVLDGQRRLLGIVSMADLVGRSNVKTAETHETLKTVSAPTDEPSKPRAKSHEPA